MDGVFAVGGWGAMRGGGRGRRMSVGECVVCVRRHLFPMGVTLIHTPDTFQRRPSPFSLPSPSLLPPFFSFSLLLLPLLSVFSIHVPFTLTRPASLSRPPGDPTPIPEMSGHWSPAADKAASQQARSVRTTGSGFRPSAVVSSGSDALLRTVPVSSTTAALALVAPRSIPTHTGGLERAGRQAGRVGRAER